MSHFIYAYSFTAHVTKFYAFAAEHRQKYSLSYSYCPNMTTFTSHKTADRQGEQVNAEFTERKANPR